MIIYLTKTSGVTVAVHFNMVTYIEECGGYSEVHFPNSYISVKESLRAITREVERQKLMEGIRK